MVSTPLVDQIASAPTTNPTGLAFKSATELAGLIESRKVSPVELVKDLLSRIEHYNSLLVAYINVDSRGALAAAEAAESEIRGGGYRGPLHGIPVAYKDIFDVQGLPTTANSRVMLGYVASRDSTVAHNLRRAGAICLGKLNTNEFASGSMEVFGEARNPWNTDMSPGGSSSGPAVATAAHLVTVSVGTDTGGSIRVPSAFNGTVGFKPTYGRVSRAGMVPLSWSLDHAGPMTRTVADNAILLREMAGWDSRDASTSSTPVPDYVAQLSPDLLGIRLGVPKSFFFDSINAEVLAAVHAAISALKELGASIYEVDLPHAKWGPVASWTIAYTEAFAFHRSNFFGRPRDYTPAFLHKIASAACLTAEERITAERIRQIVSYEFLEALAHVDAILTPTMAHPAFRLGGAYPEGDVGRLTRPVSVAGLPALAVPCGFTSGELPISMQLVGRAWDEATLLRIGYAYERATPWHQRHAPLTGSTVQAQSKPGHQEQNIVVSPDVQEVGEKVDASWVAKWAQMAGLSFIEEADAAPIAAAVAPVKALLSAARAEVASEIEPAVRPVTRRVPSL